MTIEKTTDKITVSGTSDFDAAKTLECGQVFRFKKLSENDYTLIAGDKACRIYTDNGKTVIETPHTDFFCSYFDLSTDYAAIAQKLSQFPELMSAVEAGRGIRILRQDPFETVISFIISANNNIPRIKGIIERLCSHFGRDMGGYHAFVTKEDFYKMSREDFTVLRAGFREDYLYHNRETLNDEGFYERILKSDTRAAESELLKLKGVGPKVASCIMLFSLLRFDSYPVDTWIFKANKSDSLNTPEKVRAFYQDRYGNLAGYAQQYIFFSKRNLKL